MTLALPQRLLRSEREMNGASGGSTLPPSSLREEALITVSSRRPRRGAQSWRISCRRRDTFSKNFRLHVNTIFTVETIITCGSWMHFASQSCTQSEHCDGRKSKLKTRKIVRIQFFLLNKFADLVFLLVLNAEDAHKHTQSARVS